MNNPFDLDIETLLAQKIQYHIEQIKYHDKMASEARQKLELLLAGRQNNPDLLHDTGKANDQVQGSFIMSQDFSEDKGITFDTGKRYSVTYWRPLVEEYLRRANTYVKTDDIFTGIKSRSYYAPAERRRIITAISSSLYSLVENKKVLKMESEGRGNSYKWIG